MGPRERAIIIAALITTIGGVIVAFMYIVLPRVLPVQTSTTTAISFGAPTNTPVIVDTSVPPTQPPSTPTPNQGSSPLPEPRPQSAGEIASKLGGDASDWSPLGSNGWVYRGGSETNSFTVPHWCVVGTTQGRLYPGEQVEPQVALTIYYNVSSYDLAGHNP